MDRVSFLGLFKAGAFLTLGATLLATVNIPHHFFDLFSHFRLQYLGACLLLLLLFATLGEKIYALALLVGTALNAAVIVPWYLSETTIAGDQRLTVVHANVLSKNTDYTALGEFLHATDPDVVFLQEFNFGWLQGTQALRERWPHVHAEARTGSFGIAVFSKLPFDSVALFTSPPLNHPSLKATLSVEGKPITLFSTHPMIPLGESLSDARNQQLDHVAELVNKSRGPVALLGDFNATMWDRHYLRLEKTTGLRNARKGFGIAPSWPTFMLPAMIPIDHVLVSPDVAVLDHRMGRRIGSDHLPLIVTLSF